MNNEEGYIYLIHFEQPYGHARHYVGWTKDLAARIQAHQLGHGARLMAVINEAKIPWKVVRVWPGSRKFERKIKNRKATPRLCPKCNQALQPTLFELTPSQIEDELIPF